MEQGEKKTYRELKETRKKQQPNFNGIEEPPPRQTNIITHRRSGNSRSVIASLASSILRGTRLFMPAHLYPHFPHPPKQSEKLMKQEQHEQVTGFSSLTTMPREKKSISTLRRCFVQRRYLLSRAPLASIFCLLRFIRAPRLPNTLCTQPGSWTAESGQKGEENNKPGRSRVFRGSQKRGRKRGTGPT